MVKTSSLVFILSLIAWVQVGCTREERNSVLVLAFEQLGSQDNLCERDRNPVHKSGFEILCPESIQFTQAYVPTPLTLPNLSTLLTGLYPLDHRVRHNGTPGLKPEMVTVAERVSAQGVRTSFFSGGPPVFRKSGLHQGFETFNDSFRIGSGVFFRPFEESLRLFKDWLRVEAKSQSFLSVIYAPDLFFAPPEIPRGPGELRTLGFESPWDRLDENLADLFLHLKQSKRWESTTIIVVGVSSLPLHERINTPRGLNLHGDHLKVALYIKPASRPPAVTSARKFDAPISLADIGQTIFDLEDLPLPTSNKQFKVYSLRRSIEKTSTPWLHQRFIPVESAWAAWHGVSGIRSGLISDHDFFLFDQIPKLYNTLTDRSEKFPLRVKEPPSEKVHSYISALTEAGYRPWEMNAPWLSESLSWPVEDWLENRNWKKILGEIESLAKDSSPHPSLTEWGAWLAFRHRVQNKIPFFLRKLHNPSWAAEDNFCFTLPGQSASSFSDRKLCSSKMFLQWLDWAPQFSRRNENDLIRSSFFQTFSQLNLHRLIQKLNWSHGLMWNEIQLSNPQLNELDFYLAQPNNIKQQLFIYRTLEIQSQNSTEELIE